MKTTPLQILVAEDSEADCLLMMHQLKKADFIFDFKRVWDQETMETALDSQSWDLILSDYAFPGFSGLAALLLAKRKAPETPFLIVSGQVGEEVAVEMLKAGASDFILKNRMLRLPNAIEQQLHEVKLQKKLKDTEEQLRAAQKMEAIGLLAGGIAHDFNNILTVILLQCDLLLNKAKENSSDAGEALEIFKAAEYASSLTRQLLAYSRRQVLSPENVKLNDCITKFKDLLGRLVPGHIQMRVHLDPRTGFCRTDPDKLQQVLMNLIINAKDAMPNGGSLLIQTAPLTNEERESLELQPGDYWVLSVQDSGTGMSPQTLERIFDPFFTTKKVGKGTGLGLSIVHGIINQSGGTIRVKSEIGEGTCFSIYLPAVEGQIQSPEKPQKQQVKKTEAAPKTILLVEDQKPVREAMATLLEQQQYLVLQAENGEEALLLLDLSLTLPDLVIIDAIMPDMGGWELIENLKTRQPNLSILLASGHKPNPEQLSKISDANFNVLAKPFSKQVLIEKVHQILNLQEEASI